MEDLKVVPMQFTEFEVESAALAWLEDLSWAVKHSSESTPDTPVAELADYSEVVLAQRLREALLPKLIAGRYG